MRILVFVGPSGSGKSTLIRELHRRGIVEVMPSWTTRPRRDDEAEEDVDHLFVGNEDFDELEKASHFLETVELFGFRYGLPAINPSSVDRIPAISVRAHLLDLVAEHFPDHVVYQIESRLEVARERITRRGGSRLEMEARLDSFTAELAFGRARCSRSFDTSDPSADVAGAVERAIEEDFQVERSRS